MIDKSFTNRFLLFLLVSFVLPLSGSCIRQSKDTKVQGVEESENYSFIDDKRIREYIDCFINDTSRIHNSEKQRITILLDYSENKNEIRIFRMLSFAYTIEKSIFLGAPTIGDNRVVVFCKDSIPSFINTSFLNYNKGLEYLGEDALYYMWNNVRTQGEWLVLRQEANFEWLISDSGVIGERGE